MEDRCSFALGFLTITPNAMNSVPPRDLLAALKRYCSKDWGEVCKEDWAENDRALLEERRLLGSYKSETGISFWIITEQDRSYTTILLPEDY